MVIFFFFNITPPNGHSFSFHVKHALLDNATSHFSLQRHYITRLASYLGLNFKTATVTGTAKHFSNLRGADW